jgi:signal peptidase II
MIKIKYLVLLSVTGTIIALDQLTKHLVIERFQLGESISIIQNFFNLTYVRNTGAAFGLFAQTNPAFRVPFFLIIPLIALASIFYLFKNLKDDDHKLSTAFSLIIGGAIGNLIDRLAYSYVIDFLDFHWKYQIHFPAFNVADSVICIGVALLTIDMLQKEAKEKKN